MCILYFLCIYVYVYEGLARSSGYCTKYLNILIDSLAYCPSRNRLLNKAYAVRLLTNNGIFLFFRLHIGGVWVLVLW